MQTVECMREWTIPTCRGPISLTRTIEIPVLIQWKSDPLSPGKFIRGDWDIETGIFSDAEMVEVRKLVESAYKEEENIGIFAVPGMARGEKIPFLERWGIISKALPADLTGPEEKSLTKIIEDGEHIGNSLHGFELLGEVWTEMGRTFWNARAKGGRWVKGWEN